MRDRRKLGISRQRLLEVVPCPASLTLVPLRYKLFELGQSLEVFQPGVADLGVAEVQRLELGQSFEVFQPGVADLGAARSRSWSWVNPLRCSSPASVTLVSLR